MVGIGYLVLRWAPIPEDPAMARLLTFGSGAVVTGGLACLAWVAGRLRSGIDLVAVIVAYLAIEVVLRGPWLA